MPTVDVVVETPVRRSFRVDQVAGMFDLALEKTARAEFHGELPGLDEEWQIGAIVGPSGSGKTTLARHAFGDALCGGEPWPADSAVIDGFGNASIKKITHALTAVGFCSPPSWVKPYHVLSNGERFRCDLARALLREEPLIVFDEFTSVVDRTVAKIGSAAVAKAIRKGRIARRFVAVACHYDIIEWLTPDWVLDMASGRLARGSLRRPAIELAVYPVLSSAWGLFRRHHYLSGKLSGTALCWAAFWGDVPVAFSAWVTNASCPRLRKLAVAPAQEHRTVVLPDYQGLGIGTRLADYCASILAGVGRRVYSTTSHPAVIAHRSRSPNWRRHRLAYASRDRRPQAIKYRSKGSAARITGGFCYVGPAMPRPEALALAQRANTLLVLSIIQRWPGCATSALRRHSGLSGGVDHILQGLLAAGRIRREGPGGGHGRQYAYYPAVQ